MQTTTEAKCSCSGHQNRNCSYGVQFKGIIHLPNNKQLATIKEFHRRPSLNQGNHITYLQTKKFTRRHRNYGLHRKIQSLLGKSRKIQSFQCKNIRGVKLKRTHKIVFTLFAVILLSPPPFKTNPTNMNIHIHRYMGKRKREEYASYISKQMNRHMMTSIAHGRGQHIEKCWPKAHCNFYGLKFITSKLCSSSLSTTNYMEFSNLSEAQCMFATTALFDIN